jgi:hypothetical protein
MKRSNIIKHPVFIITAALIVIGCSDRKHDRQFELDELSFDGETMHTIESMSSFTIPQGSRGLNFAYKPPVDPGFAARLEIPALSRESVMKQIEGIEGQATVASGAPPLHVTWWLSKRENVLAEKQAFNGSGKSSKTGYHHAILTKEGAKLILYLHYHTP